MEVYRVSHSENVLIPFLNVLIPFKKGISTFIDHFNRLGHDLAHASTQSNRTGRDVVSCAQSREWADENIPEGLGLSGVREGAGRDAGEDSGAAAGLLSDAQSLASGALAKTGWGPGPVHAAADRHACSALA